MEFLLDFTEAAASVPDPVNLAGYVLAAALIRNPWWASGAGVSWGLGLWLVGVLLDDRQDWGAQKLLAQFLGSLAGNMFGMLVVVTVADTGRAVRARWIERRSQRHRRR